MELYYLLFATSSSQLVALFKLPVSMKRCLYLDLIDIACSFVSGRNSEFFMLKKVVIKGAQQSLLQVELRKTDG